jgi:hypothetical protein
MTAKSIKKLITLISFLALMGSSSPIFAQLVELEILGGGYKIRGPAEINFLSQTTSTSPTTNTLDFQFLGQTTPAEADHNYIMIVDENGGNPFDVTVSSSELKRDETLVTTSLGGSTSSELKVAGTTEFTIGDTFILPEIGNDVYKIVSIPDIDTLVIEGTFAGGPPPDGTTVSRYVDCEISPKRCIPLSDFSISNGNTVDTVFGDSTDYQKNSQTNELVSFMGSSTTIAGSTGNTLKVDNANKFTSNETITFPASSGVSPLTNTISTVDDGNTITLLVPFTAPPAAGINVKTGTRTLTLGNGNGAAPGQWKIYPVLQNIISAGQIPGTYQAILNFTIV